MAEGDVKTNFEQFKTLRYLRRLIASTPKGLNIMIWGPPGIGKSISIQEYVQEEGLGFLDTRLSQLDSIDLRGFPRADEDGKYADFIPFKNILPIPEIHGPEGILFLDESNLASIDVMKAGYQLLTDKKIGGYTLPPGWRILLAGNRPEDAPGVVRDLPVPLKNRMYHFEVTPPITEEARQDLFTWYYKHDVHPSAIAFLKMNPSHIHDMTNAVRENAWPSPRSWTMASEAIMGMGIAKEDGSLDFGRYEEMMFLVGDAVGKGEAISFSAFAKVYERLPNARKILTDGYESINNIPDRKDKAVVYALTTSMVANLRDPELYTNPSVVRNYFDYIKTIDKEFAIKSIKDCAGIKGLWQSVLNNAEYKKYAAENVQYLRL